MSKKKPTKKDIEAVISHMISHLRYIEEKVDGIDGLFGLYLDWKKDRDKFNKFAENKVIENQKKISENEPGETK